MDRILKIVYCNPALHVSGGGERVLTVKANYFAEKLGYEIHIVTTDGGKYPPFFTLHPSVKVHQLNINYDDYFSPCRRVWEFFHKRYLHKKRLNRCLNKIKPDITVIMTRREVGFIASMTDGSVKIAENHVDKSRYMDSMNPHLSKFLPMWLKRRYRENIIASLSKLDKFILLTHEDEKAWTELHNLAVIPNPLTIIPDGVSRCENKRVIAVGRYEHQKGFDLLLKAWKEVANTHKDWTMHIYGEGILRENLQKQLISLGLEDSCFLEHHTLQIGECFKTSSLFVLISRFEGFGVRLFLLYHDLYRRATGQLYNSCHKNDISCSNLMNITVRIARLCCACLSVHATVSSGGRSTESVLFISTGCGTDAG